MTDVQHPDEVRTIPDTRVIINPAARGGKTIGQWQSLSELLMQNGVSFDFVFTEGPGDGIRRGKEAIDAGCKTVVAVGGDGTVNEVINGIVDKDGRSKATLGIICTGTGRDCIRSLNIPADYREACKLIAKHDCINVDLGIAEYISDGHKKRRYFINTSAMGFAASVAERTRRFKRMGGTIPFLMAFTTVFLTYKAKDTKFDTDGQAKQEKLMLIAVNNGRYFGGGMKITPNADPCDGMLDVTALKDVNKLRLLYNFPMLYRGTHIAHPKVSAYRAKHVDVQTPDGMLLQLDGEIVGEAPASFSIIPSALKVISGGYHG